MDFITKQFSAGDVSRRLVDPWLKSLMGRDIGIQVVGYTEFDDALTITVKRYHKSTNVPPWMQERTTIDDIPEEPSVDIDAGAEENETAV